MSNVDIQVKLLLKDQCTNVNSKDIKINIKENNVVNGLNTVMEIHAKECNNHANGQVLKLKEVENVHANGKNIKVVKNKDVVVSSEDVKENLVEQLEKNANGLENLSKQEQLKEDVTGKFMEKILKERDVVIKQLNVFHIKERKNVQKLFTLVNGQDLK